jgi:hypothetical protein
LCCKEDAKTAYGYIWRYENNKLKSTEIEQKIKLLKNNKTIIEKTKMDNKTIIQYTLNKKFIRKYRCIREAAKINNLDKYYCIQQCCVYNYKTAYGYIWRFEGDELEGCEESEDEESEDEESEDEESEDEESEDEESEDEESEDEGERVVVETRNPSVKKKKVRKLLIQNSDEK